MDSFYAIVIKFRASEQNIPSILLIPSGIEDDRPTGINHIESLDNHPLVNDLATEPRNESKQSDRSIQNEVLVKHVANYIGISPISLSAMVEE